MKYYSVWTAFVILFIFLCFDISTGYALEPRLLELTEKEKIFIKNHPVIRVSNEIDWPPFDFAIGDQPFGLSIDLMDMLAKMLGIKLKYINGYTWNELLEMFKDKRIDILQSIYKSETRQEFGNFTAPYFKDKTAFITLKNSPDILDISELKGKIVAVPKGWGYENYLVENYSGINLLIVSNIEQAFRYVKDGKADATIELEAVARYGIKKNFFVDLKISGWFKQYDQNEYKALHLLVRKDWLVLHNMLEKALKTITPGDISNLEKKWLDVNNVFPQQQLNFTLQEQTFLETHPVIKVANELDWPPFDFVEHGEPAGFVIDYVKLLGEISGIKFDFINGYTWSELLEMGQQKELDLFPGLWKSSEREEFLTFTNPYLELIKVLVIRKDEKQIKSLSDMKDKTIAMPEGYTLTNIVMMEYPNYDYILVKNPREGLMQVSLGKADAFIGSLGVINFIIQKHFIDNVKVVSEVKLLKKLSLHMAVKKDLPILKDILNKTMKNVRRDQFDAIVKKWIGSTQVGEDLINLTNEEKAYLDKKDKISMCVQSDYKPFESINDKGEYQGIVADYYKLVGRKIGLPVKIVQAVNFKESLEYIKSGECDIISIVQKKHIDSKLVNFTIPYVEYPLVIATGSKAIYINSIDNIAGKKIGISQDSQFYDDIKNQYPDIDFINVDNVEKGLSRVQGGELFGMVETAPKIGFYIQSRRMFDLKISGELPYQMKLRTGIHHDDKMLYNIFEKAINSLTKDEKKNIFQSWMTIKYEQGFDYSLLIKILIVMGIVGSFFVYRHISISQYNIKLAGLNKQLTTVNRKLETISFIDGLTGVPNRRKFDSVLKNEWDRCKRSQKFLTLIMLDIDFFKRFNDKYGHLEGDECLKIVAKTISNIPSRPGDFVGRYGGEEFVIVLPDTEETGAIGIIKKILIDVINLKIPHEDSDVSDYLTVSMGGMIAVPDQNIPAIDFVNIADQQLYKAKNAGRNQYKFITKET